MNVSGPQRRQGTYVMTKTNELSGFEALGLSADLLSGLEALGFDNPTPIQQRAIPVLLEGSDIIGLAQTGTGKTAAFALPLLERIDITRRETQVLVLAPTRELALQVAEAFRTYSKQMPGLRTAAIFGGQAYGPQLRALNDGPHVVVGTPGRVIDHLSRGSLRLESLSAMVLDEADEMLRMGFIDDVVRILESTPDTRQTALFSATMPNQIRHIAGRFLRDPVEIVVEAPKQEQRRIRQRACIVPERFKTEVLYRFLETEETDAVIIFTRTRATCLELAELLQGRGFAAAALNGDLAQELRERTVQRVRDGELDLLVATDVAARGLDLDRITHVVNFDLPNDSESFVHRIGRTGRAGRTGEAILLLTPRERYVLRRLEHAVGGRIEVTLPPSAEQVNSSRTERFLERVEQAMDSEHAERFHELLEDYAEENELDPLKLAAAVATLTHGANDFFVGDLPDFGARREPSPRDRADRGPRGRVRQDRYRIEVGRAHGVHIRLLLDTITRTAGLDRRRIGDIRILEEHSFLELPTGMPRDIFERLNQTEVCRRPLRLSRIEDRHPSRRP